MKHVLTIEIEKINDLDAYYVKSVVDGETRSEATLADTETELVVGLYDIVGNFYDEAVDAK